MKIEERNKVTAKVILDSISPEGDRITTIEHEEPRIIHSEFLRHRKFSNSVASSRAIPAKTMRKNIRNKMFIPWYWGKEKPGMQAKEEIHPFLQKVAKISWIINAYINLGFSWWYSCLGLHKQLANRNTEYISYIKVLTTSTDYDNFFELRDNELAQPEIQELAKKMKQAIQKSKPKQLNYGEWHTPYVDYIKNNIPVEIATKISVSCCAQTSYRKHDETVETAIRITDKLKTSKPIHASPFEHVCTPSTGKGSGNSTGWYQMRHYIE